MAEVEENIERLRAEAGASGASNRVERVSDMCEVIAELGQCVLDSLPPGPDPLMSRRVAQPIDVAERALAVQDSNEEHEQAAGDKHHLEKKEQESSTDEEMRGAGRTT